MHYGDRPYEIYDIIAMHAAIAATNCCVCKHVSDSRSMRGRYVASSDAHGVVSTVPPPGTGLGVAADADSAAFGGGSGSMSSAQLDMDPQGSCLYY